MKKDVKIDESINLPLNKDELFALANTLILAKAIFERTAQNSFDAGDNKIAKEFYDRVQVCTVFINKIFDHANTSGLTSEQLH